MLNIPLLQDVAALRLVGTDKYIDGWIDRKVLNPFPRDQRQHGARQCCRGARGGRFSTLEHGTLAGGPCDIADSATDRLSITLG